MACRPFLSLYEQWIFKTCLNLRSNWDSLETESHSTYWTLKTDLYGFRVYETVFFFSNFFNLVGRETLTPGGTDVSKKRFVFETDDMSYTIGGEATGVVKSWTLMSINFFFSVEFSFRIYVYFICINHHTKCSLLP